MRARVLTWLLAVLLLGMQHATQVHAISHLRGPFDRPHQQGLQAPSVDALCLVCTLSAGGANAIISEAPHIPSPGAPSAATWVITASPTHSAPSHYLSRAPPSLL